MKTFRKIIAGVLCFLMLVAIVPYSAFAASAAETSNGKMTTASSKVSALAPGVTETEVVSYDKTVTVSRIL